ncbi:MAG: AbrB/MazE/SpoVT family DNA-binding domain-containing protein [Sedimenticolaceae bacterium]
MLAKKTSKNQITLPKRVADLFPDATYLDISAEDGRIVLVPVRPDRANMVRSKLADLGIEEPDVADAIAWARRE